MICLSDLPGTMGAIALAVFFRIRDMASNTEYLSCGGVEWGGVKG